MIAMLCPVDGSHTHDTLYMFVSCSGSLIASRLLTTWSRMTGSQITNTKIFPHTF